MKKLTSKKKWEKPEIFIFNPGIESAGDPAKGAVEKVYYCSAGTKATYSGNGTFKGYNVNIGGTLPNVSTSAVAGGCS